MGEVGDDDGGEEEGEEGVRLDHNGEEEGEERDEVVLLVLDERPEAGLLAPVTDDEESRLSPITAGEDGEAADEACERVAVPM